MEDNRDLGNVPQPGSFGSRIILEYTAVDLHNLAVK
jgi:hypothetical protein